MVVPYPPHTTGTAVHRNVHYVGGRHHQAAFRGCWPDVHNGCAHCTALLAEMYCSVVEVRAIQQDLIARSAAGVDVNKHSIAWQRLAWDRRKEAIAGLFQHFAITHRASGST